MYFTATSMSAAAAAASMQRLGSKSMTPDGQRVVAVVQTVESTRRLSIGDCRLLAINAHRRTAKLSVGLAHFVSDHPFLPLPPPLSLSLSLFLSPFLSLTSQRMLWRCQPGNDGVGFEWFRMMKNRAHVSHLFLFLFPFSSHFSLFPLDESGTNNVTGY